MQTIGDNSPTLDMVPPIPAPSSTSSSPQTPIPLPTSAPNLPYNGFFTPYTALQLVCIVLLAAMAFILGDGTRDTIVQALIGIAVGNTLSGGAYGITHIIANSRIQQTLIKQDTPKV